MPKSLVMHFLTSEGKKTSLTVNDIKNDLTAQQVSAAMDTIIAKNIFATRVGDFKTKDFAEIITKEASKLTL